MYKCDDFYLYEIIEDYKYAITNEERNEIFTSFCSSIWSSKNKRRIYTKSIKFNVRKDLLDTEVGKIFDTWSDIEYSYYKAMTKEQDWCSIIRQKVNNIYTRYFDKEVILAKEYMDLIKYPKKLYFNWIDGTEMDGNSLTTIIDDTIAEAVEVKKKYQMRKMDLNWDDYKLVINGFFKKCFDNCRLIGDYEDKTSIVTRLDYLTEDHFYVGYVNKNLEGMIKDYQKRQAGLPQSSRNGYKYCKSCGTMIEVTGNKKMYCTECASKNERLRKRKIAYKYRVAK